MSIALVNTLDPDEPVDSDGFDLDFELIEALFFGYRAFVAEPDRTLSGLNFGRAHHRVLHFTYRNPGLTIAALLDILQITKQSLARVLKDLIDGGLIEQKEGADDRRQRLLYATSQGNTLAIDLARAQSERLRHALRAAGPRGREAVEQFLLALAASEDGARGEGGQDERDAGPR